MLPVLDECAIGAGGICIDGSPNSRINPSEVFFKIPSVRGRRECTSLVILVSVLFTEKESQWPTS
jgi:hypothetical protein